jgi:hypothetical protein
LKAKGKGRSKSEPTPLVTRQQLALLLGVHPQTITGWEGEGCPVARRGGRGVASKYRVSDVFKWRVESLRQVSETTLTLEQERTRLARAQADGKEMENRVRAGELLPRDQVVREGQALVRGWSAKVRGLPRRLVNVGLVPREREGDARALLLELLADISGWRTVADAEAADGQ